MSDWVRVGDAARFVVGRGRAVDVDGTAVAVFRTRDGWIALDDTCPHMGASLAAGRLSGNEVTCSWHEWRYDATTGQCPVRPWARVRVHEIKVEDGGVWVRRPGPAAEPPKADEERDPEWLRWDPSRYFKRRDGAE